VCDPDDFVKPLDKPDDYQPPPAPLKPLDDIEDAQWLDEDDPRRLEVEAYKKQAETPEEG
jgi:hypothetical protein